jgi:AcrR family transcriptional regulator
MYKNKNGFFLHLHHSYIFDRMARNKEVDKDILKEASRLFFEKGYKKVTVDEIASNLNISKKTIYKYYKSKQDLLEESFEQWQIRLSSEVNEIIDKANMTFVDKLTQMMSHVGVAMGRMNSILISDIQENVPHLWDRINTYKHEAAFLRFNRLIEEGILKGQIKKGVNKALIVALYACAIENLLDPNFIRNLPEDLRKKLPEYHSDIFDGTLKIIYEGILADEALKSLSGSA